MQRQRASTRGGSVSGGRCNDGGSGGTVLLLPKLEGKVKLRI
ncbi:hypothetical protein R4Z09_29705 [Niallia oryzisoli]|uniref:Uncharacterized protein n=1 Tax=Niallia oryzisoli TaxID=1737571 RepID=A0ABZ2CE04_9BACI